MSDDDNRDIVTQYYDPITHEHRTVTLCKKHSHEALQAMRATGTGCGSTYALALSSCDACRNDKASTR